MKPLLVTNNLLYIYLLFVLLKGETSVTSAWCCIFDGGVEDVLYDRIINKEDMFDK